MSSNNYLSPLNFRVSIERIPNIEYTAQKVNIPSLSAPNVNTGSPIGALYQAGGSITFDDLSLSFIINEDMDNYLEIHKWLTGINTPQSTDQYRKFDTTENIKSDIIVTIQNSHKNSNMRIHYRDCFPISISDVQLDITTSDIDYPEATVIFKYNYFTIEKI